MKPKKKAQVSDFRYESGVAKVGWPAVGEPMRLDDVMKIVEFLVPTASGSQTAYGRKLAEVRRAIDGLIAVGSLATKLTLGNCVKELEQAVQKYLGVRHALFLTNATAGFEIAYKMAGLGPGDEVIVPAITFIATIVYPLSIGAKVVLADLDRQTINIDPADVARKITPRTRMIVPVHIGGWPADMAPIMRLARQHDLVVLEDAAHGFGGSYCGRRLGTIGHFGAYSFHEVKNINALGEGGILVTNTKLGRQFGKSRFVGLDLSKKIPNWLYDVVAIDGMRGPFAAGNHSATEIQAVALGSQLQRSGPDHRRPPRGGPGAQSPLPARARTAWHAHGPRHDPGDTSPLPVADRPAGRRCRHPGFEGQADRARGDADPALRPALQIPDPTATGLRHGGHRGKLPGLRGPVQPPLHPPADLRSLGRASPVPGRRGHRKRSGIAPGDGVSGTAAKHDALTADQPKALKCEHHEPTCCFSRCRP